MNFRVGSSARRCCGLVFIATSAGLCLLTSRLAAQRTAPFQHGVVANGAWLQANALPLDRDAFQSADANLSIRGAGWALDGGWLRVARTLSTVQGGSLSIGRLLPWKGVVFIPAVGGFVGRGQRSVDSTGFDFVDPATGATGHTPRYSYSSAASVGGGAGLTLEIPLYRVIAVRGVAWQWFFSGEPLDGDRSRTVLGVGLSLRLPGGR